MTVIALALLACTPPPVAAEESGHSGAVAPTGLDPSTHTGAPTPLAAACVVTDNALRLACHVQLDPPGPVRIRYAPADGAEPERVVTDDAPTAGHDLVLLLLPEDTPVAWTAEAGDASVQGTTSTGHVPDVARAALEVTGTPSVPLLGSQQPCTASAIAEIFDAATGALLWYQGLDPAGQLGMLDMVQFTEDHTVLGETGVSVVEVDLAGDVLLRLERGVDYTEELHHDLYEHAGHVYLLFHEDVPGPRELQLDGFAVHDRATGARVAEWHASDHLVLPADAGGAWMHTNTLSVDPRGDVVLSSYEQDTVLAVAGDWTAPDFGQVRWTLAGSALGELGNDFAVDWSAVPGVDGFAHQHDARFADPTHLVLLDNDHGRGLVLSVDEAGRAAAVVRADPTGSAVCGAQGTAVLTPSGHLLVGCATDDGLVDRDASGQRVWSAVPVCETGAPPLVARYYPLEDWGPPLAAR